MITDNVRSLHLRVFLTESEVDDRWRRWAGEDDDLRAAVEQVVEPLAHLHQLTLARLLAENKGEK